MRLWPRKKPPPPETDAARTGREGESLAADYLTREKKFQVIARNWRSGREEIDLLAWDGPVLVMIEVKTRSKESLIPARTAISPTKRSALRRAFYAYLKTLAVRPRAVRFDVVEVYLQGASEYPVRHYPNVSFFGKHFRP